MKHTCPTCRRDESVDSHNLIFGDLSVGVTFICFPSDGDDDGHGGLRGTHNMFIKTSMYYNSRGHEGNAMRVSTGGVSNMADSIAVIKVRL